MSFPMVVIALDLGYVPLFLLGNDIDTRGWRVGIKTLFSPSSTRPRTLLVVLILLRVGGGSLLSGKRLFSTGRASKGGVGGLILSSKVILLLFSGPVLSGILRVYVAGTGGGLEHRFCLYIDGFFHGLFPEVLVTGLDIQLGSDRRFQAF